MKTRYKFFLLLVLLPLAGRPQASLDSVIAAVKATNKVLIASRLQMETEMREARTGIFLPNPEVQFDYLWGDPSVSGNRTDFGITQCFDFPSVYFQRSSQSRLVQTNASLKYLQREREVVMRAKSAWINVVAINRQLSILKHRILLADEIAQKAKLQLSRGEINVIRYHHAQMEHVNLKMEYTDLELQLNTLQNSLNQLCGGRIILVTDTVFPSAPSLTMNDITRSFIETPSVKFLENEVKIRQYEKDLTVSE